MATQWPCVGSPIGSRALAEEQLQHAAHVVGRAADDEVVGGRPPRFLQPREVRLEAAARGHHRLARWITCSTPLRITVADLNAWPSSVDVGDLGVVEDLDAERLGGAVVGVDQRLAAAEEERVGARDVQRAAERRLETHAVLRHPGAAGRRVADRHAREPLVGLPAGDLEEVLPVLLLGIGVGEHVGGRIVHRADVARVAAVAAAEVHAAPIPPAPRWHPPRAP